MLFNSLDFAVFLVIVYSLYWFSFNKNIKHQNVLILIASYVFYGWWDWRFLSLILISSIVDYTIGLKLYECKIQKQRKFLLFLSLIINLGFLGFFKYFNFFIDSFVDSFSSFGIAIHSRSLNIILPVGISFYTFQTLSYTIDIYRKKLEPTKDALSFLAFVSFFPQLVAGPIERAKNLLPQFYKVRIFDYEKSKDGLRQILWGLFKKVVVADTCAKNVDYIFENYQSLDGSMLLLGVVYFAFQIYGDFSGYSDIAIGTARLFGFDLMRNFALPYFSRDIAEFWRRWHISLSSWFRDYLYIPIGGSYGSKFKRIRNIIITFTVSGFWHGANWTFVFWGFLNGVYYIPLMLMNKQKSHKEIVAHNKIVPTLSEIFQIFTTFSLTLFAWIFFRAESISQAFGYLNGMFNMSLFTLPTSRLSPMLLVVILLLIEWVQRKKQHCLEIEKFPLIFRWSVYWAFSFAILAYLGVEKSFIYFQF